MAKLREINEKKFMNNEDDELKIPCCETMLRLSELKSCLSMANYSDFSKERLKPEYYKSVALKHCGKQEIYGKARRKIKNSLLSDKVLICPLCSKKVHEIDLAQFMKENELMELQKLSLQTCSIKKCSADAKPDFECTSCECDYCKYCLQKNPAQRCQCGTMYGRIISMHLKKKEINCIACGKNKSLFQRLECGDAFCIDCFNLYKEGLGNLRRTKNGFYCTKCKTEKMLSIFLISLFNRENNFNMLRNRNGQ